MIFLIKQHIQDITCDIYLRLSENTIPEWLRTVNSFPQAIIFRANGERKSSSKPDLETVQDFVQKECAKVTDKQAQKERA